MAGIAREHGLGLGFSCEPLPRRQSRAAQLQSRVSCRCAAEPGIRVSRARLAFMAENNFVNSMLEW